MDINHESEWEMTTTEELNDPKTSCTKKYLCVAGLVALLVWSSILVTGAIFYLDSSKVTQNASCPGRQGFEEQGNPEEQDNYPDEQVNYVEETENYPGKAMLQAIHRYQAIRLLIPKEEPSKKMMHKYVQDEDRYENVCSLTTSYTRPKYANNTTLVFGLELKYLVL